VMGTFSVTFPRTLLVLGSMTVRVKGHAAAAT
jgi:hypothetical protein